MPPGEEGDLQPGDVRHEQEHVERQVDVGEPHRRRRPRGRGATSWCGMPAQNSVSRPSGTSITWSSTR